MIELWDNSDTKSRWGLLGLPENTDYKVLHQKTSYYIYDQFYIYSHHFPRRDIYNR